MWAFEQEELKATFSADYKPASLIKDQLRSLVQRGHDVQLHFHPQWLNYKKLSDYQWNLDMRYWRLPEVGTTNDQELNIDALFTKGVATLRELFKDIEVDYQTNVFRAGAWSIQPEKEILAAMVKNGLAIDTTVAPGLKYDDQRTKYDFQKAPMSKQSWKIHDDCCVENKNGGILEIPIATAQIPFLMRLYFQLLKIPGLISKSARNNEVVDDSYRRSYPITRSILKLINDQRKMLNFSDGTVSAEMKYIFKKRLAELKSLEGEGIPIVAISHPKTFNNGQQLNSFLSWLNDQSMVSFGTFQDYIKTDK
ncbi:MAG: hypothetical protein RIE58_11610 [Vicingaceae bacterium]